MRLIDSHAHLTYPGLIERVEQVLDNAAQAGVEHIITVACNAADAEASLKLAQQYETVSCTAGIHPHDAAKIGDYDVARIERLLPESQVVAIGEIGLDYYYDFSDRQSQLKLLDAQLGIATQHDLPLVIHCREAFDDTIDLLNRHGFKDKPVVFHCFTGSQDDSQHVADNGWLISFTGVITFKKSEHLAEIAAHYPLDQIMLETDAPYLSPVPVRNKKPNEPAYVVHTARFIADRRGMDLEQFANQTAENTRRFFNLTD